MLNTVRIAELRNQFERKGFIHVQGFLSPAELSEAMQRVERYKREIAPMLESHRVLYDTDGDNRSVKHLVELDKADPYFAAFLNGKPRRLASGMLGENALPQNVEYFDKGPFIGKPTPAHQDGFYFCLKPNHAITLWIALEDCDEENGCMSYVPGSHKHGIIEHHASGVVGFSQELNYAPSPGEKLFMARGNAGDCFAHHSMTIHLAGPNKSDRHRPSLGCVYYGERCERDEEAWARYLANVELQRKLHVVGATR